MSISSLVLGQVRDTKFGTKVPNTMLVHAAKCQGYSFYHFWVIKRKPTRGKITPPPPTHTHTHTHPDWVNVCNIAYKTDLAMRGV